MKYPSSAILSQCSLTLRMEQEVRQVTGGSRGGGSSTKNVRTVQDGTVVKVTQL
jgi:hypothetical protein